MTGLPDPFMCSPGSLQHYILPSEIHLPFYVPPRELAVGYLELVTPHLDCCLQTTFFPHFPNLSRCLAITARLLTTFPLPLSIVQIRLML